MASYIASLPGNHKSREVCCIDSKENESKESPDISHQAGRIALGRYTLLKYIFFDQNILIRYL